MSVAASSTTTIYAQQKHTADRSCCNAAVSVLCLIEPVCLFLASTAQLLQESLPRKRSDASLSPSLSFDMLLDERRASAPLQKFFDTALPPAVLTFSLPAQRIARYSNDFRSRNPGTATPGHYTMRTSTACQQALRFPPFIRQSDWTDTPRIYETRCTSFSTMSGDSRYQLGSLSLCHRQFLKLIDCSQAIT